MKQMLGAKVGMTQIFQKDGKKVPVTLINAGPLTVVQIKSDDRDGYSAIQVGYGENKNLNKAAKGHMKKTGRFRYLREFSVDSDNSKDKIEDKKDKDNSYKIGDTIKVDVFSEGDCVKIVGDSKGRGFAGVVKRHGFHGASRTHGHRHDQRSGGSIGAAFPEHVFKGQKMAGRMGGERVTTRKSEIIRVDPEKNILAVKGAVPGARNSLVTIIGE